MTPPTARRARFGPFEFDPRTGELHGPDGTVRLSRQRSQLLEILVEHAPGIATRKEIEQKLWPNTTFIEFEISIRAAIRHLRKALGDSVGKPRYIETIKRFGYRIMVPVEWIEVSPEVNRSDQRFQVDKLSGLMISHYLVKEVIGRGGMGIVYRAHDRELYRHVALKFLPEELAEDAQARARFKREAQAVASLNHPNVCPVYEFAQHEGHPFIAMELLHGQSLREHIAEGRFRLTRGDGLDVAIQVARGLEAAHQNGIVHRDIKPANIFITNRGQVKILDFGVALVIEGDQATDQVPVPEPGSVAQPGAYRSGTRSRKAGTAGYMSPEQIRGEPLDGRTDIFSFGLVLYQMATGDRAFGGDRDTVQNAILNLEARSVKLLAPEISPKLEAIVDKCLQKEREKRYASMSELLLALEVAGPEWRFVFAPSSGELHGPAGTIQLSRELSDLLQILIEHRPDVVRTAVIKKILWAADTTFLESDVAIRANIKKLRDALGDSPENPKYIETVPHEGYRLMLPVELAKVGPAASASDPPRQPGSSSGTAPSNVGIAEKGERLRRVLEAAAPGEAILGKPMEVVAMVRRVRSEGLREYLHVEMLPRLSPDDVRERPFQLEFEVSKSGRALTREIILRLQSPACAPSAQTKKLAVPANGDSEPCIFQVTPFQHGELLLVLELLNAEEHVLASRPLRTQVVHELPAAQPALTFVAIPLELIASHLKATAAAAAPGRMALAEEHTGAAHSADGLLDAIARQGKLPAGTIAAFIHESPELARILTRGPNGEIILGGRYRVHEVIAASEPGMACFAEDLQKGKRIMIAVDPHSGRITELPPPERSPRTPKLERVGRSPQKESARPPEDTSNRIEEILTEAQPLSKEELEQLGEHKNALLSGGITVLFSANAAPDTVLNGRYHLLEEISEGAMGTVYLALDLQTGIEGPVLVKHRLDRVRPPKLDRVGSTEELRAERVVAPPTPHSSPIKPRWVVALISLALIMIGFYGWLGRYSHTLSPAVRIAVAPFSTAPEAAHLLAATPGHAPEIQKKVLDELRKIPESEVVAVASGGLQELLPDTSWTQENITATCRANSATILVTGGISVLSTPSDANVTREHKVFGVSVVAWNCLNAAMVGSAQSTAENVEQLPQAIETAASSLSQRIITR